MSIISDGVQLLGLVNKGANADLYSKLGKWIDEARELYTEREKLEQDNKDLREQLRFKGAVKHIGSHVYEDGDEYPICSRCADVDHRAVHLMSQQDRSGVCPQCKSPQRRFLRRSEVERMEREGASI